MGGSDTTQGMERAGLQTGYGYDSSAFVTAARRRFVTMDDDPWQKTYFHRAIQTSIGRALRAQYDLSEPLPDQLSSLLQRLDEATGSSGAAGDTQRGPQARW